MRNRLFITLWTLLLFLLGLGSSHVLHRQNDDLVSTVFRGDMRGPEAIKNAGGFFPRHGPTELGRELTKDELEKGSSLFYHHTGSTAKYTEYVSTTTDAKIAKQFATPFRAAQEGIKETGYVYRISADPKMIDLVKSLGPENMIKAYVPQAEQAVVGGVPYNQIEGWYKVSDLADENLAAIQGGSRLDAKFTANPEFDKKFLEMRGSPGQPQLAYFRKSVKGRNKSPWKEFKEGSVRERLNDFRAKVAPEVKAPQAAAAAEEETVFVEADALGARDLIGALDVGEIPEGFTSVELGAAAEAAEAEVVTAELEALEAAEAAEALAAWEALGAAAELAEVSALGELLPWLLLL